MEFWVTPPGREPQPAEVHAEGKENTEWGVEEGSYEYQQLPGPAAEMRTVSVMSASCYFVMNMCVCTNIKQMSTFSPLSSSSVV